jgi:hypothetical protein
MHFTDTKLTVQVAPVRTTAMMGAIAEREPEPNRVKEKKRMGRARRLRRMNWTLTGIEMRTSTRGHLTLMFCSR